MAKIGGNSSWDQHGFRGNSSKDHKRQWLGLRAEAGISINRSWVRDDSSKDWVPAVGISIAGGWDTNMASVFRICIIWRVELSWCFTKRRCVVVTVRQQVGLWVFLFLRTKKKIDYHGGENDSTLFLKVMIRGVFMGINYSHIFGGYQTWELKWTWESLISCLPTKHAINQGSTRASYVKMMEANLHMLIPSI